MLVGKGNFSSLSLAVTPRTGAPIALPTTATNLLIVGLKASSTGEKRQFGTANHDQVGGRWQVASGQPPLYFEAYRAPII